MTQKDFRRLAACIKDARKTGGTLASEDYRTAAENLAFAVVEEFGLLRGSVERREFLQACGMQP